MKPEEIETIRVALLTETTHKEFEANSLKAMQILNKYEAVNNGVLDDVIKQSEQLTFDCEWCEDTGVMITGMDCTCDKAPSKS